MEKRKCKICEKETLNKIYCSEQCQHEGYKAKKTERITKKCLFCTNEFEVLITKKDKSKYCCRSCKDSHQKELYKKDGNPVYGSTHDEIRKVETSNRMKKTWESEEHRNQFKKRIEQFKLENGFHPGTDKQSQLKKKITYIKNFGVDHNWKNKENRKKCDETCLKLYGKSSYDIMIEALKKRKRTSIELKIEQILMKNKIKFENYFCVFYDIKKFKIYDFYLPDHNLLIEADGDYWHGNPNKFKKLNETQLLNKANDKFKEELAVKNNLFLERIWENEINKEDFENKFISLIIKYEKKD